MTAEKNLFWQEFWDDRAGLSTDFQATGRSGMDVPGFLFTVREIARILELNHHDTLLDIGCGTGIVSLVLSAFVQKIHAVDISAALIERARTNTKGADNISVSQASITETGRPDAFFSKILAYSVLQYLPGSEALDEAMHEVARSLKPGGRALLAANPDPARRGALEKAIDAKPDPEMRNKERGLLGRTSWFSNAELIEAAQRQGLRGRVQPIHPRIWQHFYMSDFVVEKHAE